MLKRACVVLVLMLAMWVVAEDVHDFSNLDAVKIPEGTATQPGLLLSDAEGEVEGEQEGLYRVSEGEGEGDGVGVSVDGVSAGVFRDDGLHGDTTGSHSGATAGTHTGDVDGGDVTADSYETNEGEGYIKLRRGDSDDPVIYSDNEGEQEGIYPLAEGEDGWGVMVDGAEVVTIEDDGLHGDTQGTHTGDVDGGDVTVDTITMNEGEGEGLIRGYLQGNVQGNLTGNSAGTHTGAVSLPDGSEGEPSDYYTNDTNTGRYRIGADEMGWVTGGTLRLRLSTTALTSTLPFLAPDGSAAAPSISFSNNTGNGLYKVGNNTIGAATSGVQRLLLDANGIMLSCDYGAYPGNDGTATVPQYMFGQPGGSNYGGMYCDSSGDVGIARNSISQVLYGQYTQTRTRSAGTFTLTDTNYYEGVAHNTEYSRAARGTSASPDYLDTDDVVKSTTYQSRDGAGTWGDTASISVIAAADHDAGETPGAIVLSATPEGSDTLTEVARAFVYNFGGFFDFPMLRTKMFNFYDSGNLDVSLGYLGSIDSNLSGITMFDLDTTGIPIMFGTDGMIYSDILSGVYQGNTWRFGSDSNEHLDFDQYDDSGSSWETKMHHDGTDFVVDVGDITVTSGDLNLTDGDVVASADDAFYLGDPSTDGSWRIIRDGNNLVHQRRESGTWTTKNTITP